MSTLQKQYLHILMQNGRYRMKLATRPILTQSVTTAVLFATGDIMAQQAVEKKGVAKHDVMRTGRMVLYGGGKSESQDKP